MKKTDVMKFLATIASILFLVAAGCQHPNEVQLKPVETGNELEVTSLVTVDSSRAQTAVDSSGVIPSDEIQFAGLILLNHVRLKSAAVDDSVSFSSVYFADGTKPLSLAGRLFGYYGIRLDALNPVTINGNSMLARPYRLRVFGFPVSWGWQYVRNLNSEYQPNTLYQWYIPTDSLGTPGSSISPSITSPGDLTVQYPVGGSVLSRVQDMVFQWIGQGNLSIIISSYEPLSKRTTPVLKLRPLVNRGHVKVGAKILNLLPENRFFVFTFVLANRQVISYGSTSSARVLVQAASVYSSYVELVR